MGGWVDGWVGGWAPHSDLHGVPDSQHWVVGTHTCLGAVANRSHKDGIGPLLSS